MKTDRKLFLTFVLLVCLLNISIVNGFEIETELNYDIVENDIMIWRTNRYENVSSYSSDIDDYIIFESNRTFYEVYNITNLDDINETHINMALNYYKNSTATPIFIEDTTNLDTSLDWELKKEFNFTISNETQELVQPYLIFPNDLLLSDIFTDEFNDTTGIYLSLDHQLPIVSNLSAINNVIGTEGEVFQRQIDIEFSEELNGHDEWLGRVLVIETGVLEGNIYGITDSIRDGTNITIRISPDISLANVTGLQEGDNFTIYQFYDPDFFQLEDLEIGIFELDIIESEFDFIAINNTYNYYQSILADVGLTGFDANLTLDTIINATLNRTSLINSLNISRYLNVTVDISGNDVVFKLINLTIKSELIFDSNKNKIQTGLAVPIDPLISISVVTSFFSIATLSTYFGIRSITKQRRVKKKKRKKRR
jgi:hypothetical protein